MRGLFAKLTFSLAYSDDDARRDLKRKVVTLFCRNAYRGLPPLPPSSLPQPNLDSTAGQCGITGHKFVYAQLSRALTDVTTVRKQDSSTRPRVRLRRMGSVSNTPFLVRFTYHISATVTNNLIQPSTRSASHESVSTWPAWGHHEHDDDQEGITTMREEETR